jgi:hypothetical protein
MTATEIYQNAGMFFPPPPIPQFASDQLSDAPESSGVYFLYEGDRLVYVGESLNVQRRLETHDHKGRFDKVGVIACDSQHRRRLESFYIGLLDPPLNHQSTSYSLKTRSRCKSVNLKCRDHSQLLRRLVDFIANHHGCSKTDLHEAIGWRKGAIEVNAALNRLVEWKFIRVHFVATPGRRKQLFYPFQIASEAVA